MKGECTGENCGNTHYTVSYEKRCSDGEHENDFKVFDTRESADEFAALEWVLRPNVYESDNEGNRI
jgi:hypothetical protein